MVKLLIVMLLVFFTACSSSPKKPDQAAGQIQPAATNADDQNKRPKISGRINETASFDPDVMYMVMVAEVAGQRGQLDVALEAYLEAARRVKHPQLAERAVAIALYVKNQEKLEEAVGIWLEQDKNNLTARKVAAMSALMVGNKEVAAEHLEVLLAKDPAGFEKTALEIAAVLQKEGKNGVIYDVFDDLSQRHNQDANLFLAKSLLAVQLNNPGQAVIDVQKALSIRPNWDKALVLQAQLAAQSGQMHKAIADLERAVEKDTGNEKLKKLLAQLLAKNNDYAEAKHIYRGLAKSNPEDAENLIALALVHLQLKEYDEAEEILVDLLDQSKWQNQVRFYLAKLEESRGNILEAIEWYEKIDDEALLLDAGLASVLLLAKDKQYQAAYSKLSDLAGRFPDQKLRLLVIEAELLSKQKNHQKAFDLLSDALKLNPEDKGLLYVRALIADRIGRLDVLESDLKKILQQDPNNVEALNALGYTLVERTTRFKEAEIYLRHALKIAPDEAAVLDSYGWLQFKLGNYEQALRYLQRAYAKQPVGEIAAHLAEVLWVLGRQEEAKELFREALAREPEDEHLLEFKRRVLAQGL